MKLSAAYCGVSHVDFWVDFWYSFVETVYQFQLSLYPILK
jgi:hypothetical protein